MECCQAGLLDGGDVNENVGTSIVRADETKSFLRIKELHRTDRHGRPPCFCVEMLAFLRHQSHLKICRYDLAVKETASTVEA